MNHLIEQIRNRASSKNTIHDMVKGLTPEPKIAPVISLSELQDLETELGFKFPPLLIRIYTEIGNGGFGPGYGLYSISEAKQLYLDFMADPENEWEKGTWPLCTWGCLIDSYVDCLDEGCPIYFTNESFGEDHEGQDLSFTLTDKDGNVISTGTSDNINDLLNGLSGGEINKEESDDEEDNDEEEVGLIYHKDTLEEWFEDWVAGVNLWDEMMGEEDDDDEEEDDDLPSGSNIAGRPKSN